MGPTTAESKAWGFGEAEALIERPAIINMATPMNSNPRRRIVCSLF
jgi:hypothetical protein